MRTKHPKSKNTPLRVLLVDDDISLNQLSEKLLSERGYQVDVALDGMAALDKLSSHSYDVAVLDNFMPRLTGIDLLRQMRELNYQTKVIMVTAVNESQLTDESLRLGADKILPKPFDFENLITSINQVCGRK
jgi:DNA-binding response OmpR family regulator